MFASEPNYDGRGGTGYTPMKGWGKRKRRWKGPFFLVVFILTVALATGIFLS